MRQRAKDADLYLQDFLGSGQSGIVVEGFTRDAIENAIKRQGQESRAQVVELTPANANKPQVFMIRRRYLGI